MSGNKEQIDVSLIGNDKIEEAIVNIQKEPTEENLVRALSIVCLLYTSPSPRDCS